MTTDSATRARERRRHRRVRVLWSAQLRFPDEQTVLTCTVTNISGGGAKLTHVGWPVGQEAGVVERLEPGAAVRVSIARSEEMPAQIVWCGRGRVGVMFHLEAAAVAAHIGDTVDLGRRDARTD